MKITEDGKKAILELSNGDMRKVLNILQSTWLAFKNVTEENVYTCVGHPFKSDIENIVKWLLNEDIKTCYKNILELKTIKGLALTDIVTEIHNSYVHRIEFPPDMLRDLLIDLADMEYHLSKSTKENIELTALIAAFSEVRKLSLD